MENIKFIVFNGIAKNSSEAIDKCGEKLEENGITDKSFSKLCKQRENDYPTGLPTSVPVAIPHAKYENINNDCICVMRLDEPVKFNRMDEPDESVNIEMVFNLVVKDSENHLKILQKLISLISDEKSLNEIMKLDNFSLKEYLEKKVVSYE